jgi:hypothetical protein
MASTGTRAPDQVRTRARSRLLDGAPVQAGTSRDGRRYPNSAGVDPHSARVAPVGRVSVGTLPARGRPARPGGGSERARAVAVVASITSAQWRRKSPDVMSRRGGVPCQLWLDGWGTRGFGGFPSSWCALTTSEPRSSSRTPRNAPATVQARLLPRLAKVVARRPAGGLLRDDD